MEHACTHGAWAGVPVCTGVAIFEMDEGWLHANVDRARLFQEGPRDGDRFHRLICCLWSDCLQGGTIDAGASLHVDRMWPPVIGMEVSGL